MGEVINSIDNIQDKNPFIRPLTQYKLKSSPSAVKQETNERITQWLSPVLTVSTLHQVSRKWWKKWPNFLDNLTGNHYRPEPLHPQVSLTRS